MQTVMSRQKHSHIDQVPEIKPVYPKQRVDLKVNSSKP